MADLFSWISFLLIMYFDVCQTQTLNLAVKKPAWMSSVQASHTVAAKGVAGSRGTSSVQGDCIHTTYGDMSPWFVVDLLGQYSVHKVTIYNRGDCCGNRLHDFVIEVYVRNPSRCPSAAFSLCKNYTGMFGSVENVVCDAPVFGRFVRLWKPTVINTNDVLNFCELEVYGVKKDCQRFRFLMASATRLVSTAIVSSTALSRVSCVQQCMLSGACVGVNYNSGTRECQLLLRPEPSDTVSIDPNWVYYGNDLC
ncbi:fucolectin-like [Haliotis asinina]|uniref:fucolectin-like n=1 Tax=Haliotis asinina TaxID=109174 RepID=UPI00353212A7